MTASKVPFGRILRRMRDVYRLWRLLRIVRKLVFNTKSPLLIDATGEANCLLEFSKLRKITSRRYSTNEAVGVYIIAKIGNYIKIVSAEGKNKEEIGISEKGVTYSTHTALVNNLAKSIASVSSLFAVLIAAIALYVAVKKR